MIGPGRRKLLGVLRVHALLVIGQRERQLRGLVLAVRLRGLHDPRGFLLVGEAYQLVQEEAVLAVLVHGRAALSVQVAAIEVGRVAEHPLRCRGRSYIRTQDDEAPAEIPPSKGG